MSVAGGPKWSADDEDIDGIDEGGEIRVACGSEWTVDNKTVVIE